MKVQYTIPGIVSSQKEPVPPDTSEVPSFRSRLQQLVTRPARRWKEVLQLDVPPRGIEWIAGPPQPEDLALQDSESLRQQWRDLLNKHAQKAPVFPEAEVEKQVKVKNMLTLLIRYQVLEQELAARYLSEGR